MAISVRRSAVVCLVAVLSLTILIPGVARAQSKLVPLVTDRESLSVSNKIARADNSWVNQAGDFAFSSGGSTALFVRRAGAPLPVRVIQSSDAVPGLPGSLIDIIGGVSLNSSGTLAFTVDIAVQDGVLQTALLTFDGNSLRTVVTGLDQAPGTGGARYERGINLRGLNDNGDLAFTAGLVTNASGLPSRTTLFIKPAAGSPVRIVGLGDVAPDTGGGTFSSLNCGTMNARGEVLLQATITGGSALPALFVASPAGIRKIAGVGDAAPDGGTFTSVTAGLINNAGQVAFSATVSAPPAPNYTAVWISSPSTGLARLVGQNDTVPAWSGSKISGLAGPAAFTDEGILIFNANVSGVPNITTYSLLRALRDGTLQPIAWRNETAPGTTQTITNWTNISANRTGVATFRATLSGTSPTYGVYQQAPGSAAPIPLVLDGQLAPLPGGGTFWLSSGGAPRTLDSGQVHVYADINGGAADYGEFLVGQSGAQALMSSAEQLPAGANMLLKTFRPSGAGNYVGFFGRRAGGQASVFMHDIAARTTSLVAADGDATPDGRLRITSTNTVHVNAAGSLLFGAQLLKAADGPKMALFLWNSGVLTKIVKVGDAVAGTTLSSVNTPTTMPPAINGNGDVVFNGSMLVNGMAKSAVFMRTSDGTITKIVAVGDIAPDGTPFYSVSNPAFMNSSRNVAFLAYPTVSGRYQGPQGLYIYTPGATPAIVKIAEVNGPSPCGGTFTQIGPPALNNVGQFAFGATMTGGPSGGLFLGSASGGLSCVAASGDATPAGGTFSFATIEYNIQLNDRGDLLFRSAMDGGPTTGYFIRRAGGQVIEKVFAQGDPAPGTDGTFALVTPSMNRYVGENVQMDQDGNIAAQSYYDNQGLSVFGCWHVKPDGSIEPLLVRGIVDPEFGGGAAISSSMSMSWNSNGRYAVKVRVSGGSFIDGIFLFVPPQPTPTPAGANVVVQPTDETTGQPSATLTFADVVQAGETTVTTAAGGPTLPSSFMLGDPPVFYNLETTAVYSGTIQVCVPFNAAQFSDPSSLRLLHYEGGVWRDVTTSGGVAGNTICGQVTSLSPFVVAVALTPKIEVSVTPSTIWPPNNKLVQIEATVRASDPVDTAPRVTLVSVTSNEPVTAGDIQAATGTDCRSFLVRATRLSNGTGRTYTITYRVTNSAGLWSEAVARVFVPHDQGK